jgi:SAM-dependent methyltransferase
MKVSKSYEDKIKKSYSDLDNISLGGWASVVDGTSVINVYTDPEYIKKYYTNSISVFNSINQIKLVDFGGGDGVLGHIVGQQLSDRGQSVALTNIDSNSKSLEYCKENYSEIEIIEQDILEPLRKDFFDIGLCRFLIQYCSKEEQPKIIKNIFDSLTKGGILVLSWPYGEEEVEYNDITAEIKAVISDRSITEQKTTRYNHLPSKMTEILENCGFVNVSFKEGGYLLHSVESWTERFNLTEQKIVVLKEIYEKFYKTSPDLFERIDGEIYLITKVAFLYSSKP